MGWTLELDHARGLAQSVWWVSLRKQGKLSMGWRPWGAWGKDEPPPAGPDSLGGDLRCDARRLVGLKFICGSFFFICSWRRGFGSHADGTSLQVYGQRLGVPTAWVVGLLTPGQPGKLFGGGLLRECLSVGRGQVALGNTPSPGVNSRGKLTLPGFVIRHEHMARTGSWGQGEIYFRTAE